MFTQVSSYRTDVYTFLYGILLTARHSLHGSLDSFSDLLIHLIYFGYGLEHPQLSTICDDKATTRYPACKS